MQPKGGTPRPRWLVASLSLVLAVILIGSAGAYQTARIPSVAEQLPPNVAPLVVTLNRPLDGSAYPANAFILVAAEAVAARPLAALELWADGARVERREAEATSARRQLSGFWSWQPGTPGEHTLLVRAVDVAGVIGQSDPVRVRASAAVDARLLITAKEGDTLEGLAGLLGASAERLAALNPELDGAGPLLPGQVVFAPLPLGTAGASQPAGAATPAPPAGPAQPAPDQAPSKVSLWLRKRVLAPAKPPPAPVLTAATEGCIVRLFVADRSGDEQGFFVYRLAATADGFERIATLPANDGTLPLEYHNQAGGGHVEYYVSSFNAAGEVPSNVYAVEVAGPGCPPPGWRALRPARGDLWLEDGKLVVIQPVDRVYYYFALDQGPWTRVPADPEALIPPLQRADVLRWAAQAAASGGAGLLQALARDSGRVFDLAAAAGDAPAPQGQHSVAVEFWGWRGGELLRLGTLQKHVEGPQLAMARFWLSSHTRLSVCSQAYGCREGQGWANEVLVPWAGAVQAPEFSWSTDAPGATGALWQLASKPFGRDFDPSPPGLLSMGVLNGRGGTFTIDLASLLRSPLEQAAAGGPARPGRAGPVAAPIGNGQPLSLVFGRLQLGGILGPAAAHFPRTYYARVTPMTGNRQAGAPSEMVMVHYGPLQEGGSPLEPPPPGIYEVHIAGFEPIVFPRSELWGCVRIARNDRYTGKRDPANPWSTIPVGTVICPEVHEGQGEQPWYQELWDSVGGAAGRAARSYEGVRNAVVDEVASTALSCGDGCRAGLGLGLDTALATTGLPPGLASLDSLSEIGKGYLVGLLAEQAAGDCGEESACRAAIEEGLGALKEAAQAGGSNAACTDEAEARRRGREPLCLPPGVVGVPVEGSGYVPARLMVQVTRRPQPVDVPESDYGRYVLHVSATASNGSLVGQSIPAPVNTYMVDGTYSEEMTETEPLTIDKPLEGELFERVERPLLRLRPGESVMLPVELQASTYWIPEHAEMIERAGGYVHYDDWLKLYFKGRVTFRASIDCYTTLGWKNCGVDGQGWDELQVDLPATYFP